MHLFINTRAALLLSLLVLLNACSQKSSEKLVITGSSTVAPLTAGIAKRLKHRTQALALMCKPEAHHAASMILAAA